MKKIIPTMSVISILLALLLGCLCLIVLNCNNSEQGQESTFKEIIKNYEGKSVGLNIAGRSYDVVIKKVKSDYLVLKWERQIAFLPLHSISICTLSRDKLYIDVTTPILGFVGLKSDPFGK